MPERLSKRMTAALCLALTVGTLALYAPVLRHSFVNYDDPDYILNNPHVKSGLTWPGIVWAFTSGYAANWHPLTWISHMADCQFFGLDPGAHHLVNVLFHTANTVLLFLLLNGMTRAPWRSAFVAALFAWHPLHVESVAWASERKDVLSAFFWMLTLMAYAHYGRRSAASLAGHRSAMSLPYLLALFFFACGLMSKPMVVTLPFVLLLLDFWPLGRLGVGGWKMGDGTAESGKEGKSQGSTESCPTEAHGDARPTLRFKARFLLIEKIPFFALALASCVITLLVQKNAMWSTASLPFHFRLANALMSYVRYLSKIFLPTDLALIYPYPHFLPPAGVIAAALVLVMLSVIFIFQAKRFPYLAVGWFWFLGTVVPTIGLVQAGVQAMADRYTYLPSIGVFILVAWGVSDLLSLSPWKPAIGALAGGAALIACLVLTSEQLPYWQNSLSLFSHTVAVTTDNYDAEDCLGKELDNIGKSEAGLHPAQAVELENEAGQLFGQAVQTEPDYPLAQFDLGMNLLERHDFSGASNHLAAAVQLLPGNAIWQYDLGVFLSQQGDPKAAAIHFNAALAVQPDFIEARQRLEQIETNSIANRSTH